MSAKAIQDAWLVQVSLCHVFVGEWVTLDRCSTSGQVDQYRRQIAVRCVTAWVYGRLLEVAFLLCWCCCVLVTLENKRLSVLSPFDALELNLFLRLDRWMSFLSERLYWTPRAVVVENIDRTQSAFAERTLWRHITRLICALVAFQLSGRGLPTVTLLLEEVFWVWVVLFLWSPVPLLPIVQALGVDRDRLRPMVEPFNRLLGV